jgi:hypothetical protein
MSYIIEKEELNIMMTFEFEKRLNIQRTQVFSRNDCCMRNIMLQQNKSCRPCEAE